MKKITLGALTVLLATAAAICFILPSSLQTKIKKLKESDSALNTQLSSYIPDYFINEAANQCFNTKQEPDDDVFGLMYAEEGFRLISYSKEWTTDKLKLLYKELLKNKHGEEIKSLREIIVYPHNDPKSLASFEEVEHESKLKFLFPAIPPDFSVTIKNDAGVIKLYNGNTFKKIENMAISLSHEYGHLYTFYHMFEDNTDLSGTDYAKLRKLGDQVNYSTYTGEHYYENHHKYLMEIAANDYVILMGSPTTRQILDVPDIRQILDGAKVPSDIDYKTLAANGWPQENLMIPLPNDVPGMTDYFYSFIDEQPTDSKIETQKITLNIEKSVTGYNLQNGYSKFTSHIITWNTPYKNAVYTLVCYEKDNYSPTIIKTVRPGKEAKATIGSVAKAKGNMIYYNDDNLNRGTKTFIVIVSLPDGSYRMSDRLDYTF